VHVGARPLAAQKPDDEALRSRCQTFDPWAEAIPARSRRPSVGWHGGEF